MQKVLIIGNSAAGISAAQAIRKKDKDVKITMVSDENYSTYCRCLISYFLAGDIKEKQISWRSDDFFKENNIEVLLNKKAIEIRPKKNLVIAVDNDDESKKKIQLEYDTLVLANGASAKFPDKKGIKKKGVFGFRTIDDVKQISDLLPITSTACVLGGGLIGLKAAYGLRKKGIEVKIIVRSKQVLSQVLDKQSADMFQERIQEHGIEVVTGMDVTEILGNGSLKAIKLDSNKVIGCTIVVVGKGVSPNINLVKETGIEVDEGILVGDNMQTNIPNIYAAGDVCQTYHPALNQKVINALWPNAVDQGKIAGANIVGENLKYDGSMGMNSVEFFDLPMISMGITRPREEGCVEIAKKGDNVYKKLVLKDNLLVGAILVGKVANSGVYLDLIKKRIDVSSVVDELLNPNFSYAKAFHLVGREDTRYSEVI